MFNGLNDPLKNRSQTSREEKNLLEKRVFYLFGCEKSTEISTTFADGIFVYSILQFVWIKTKLIKKKKTSHKN